MPAVVKPIIRQRTRAKPGRKRRQHTKPPPTDEQVHAWLLEVDADLVGLVRRAARYDLCDADVDDVAQMVRIRLLDDLKRFDPDKGTLLGFARLRARWEVQRHRQKPKLVEVGVLDVEEHAPDADELFAQDQWEAMTSDIVDDVIDALPPLEADAVLTIAKVHSVDDVMKKHGVKRRWVETKRKVGIGKMRKHVDKKWGPQ